MPYGIDFRNYTDKGCPLPLGGKVQDKKGRTGLVIDKCLSNRLNNRESYLKVSVRWDDTDYNEKRITNVKPSSLTVLEVYKYQVWVVSSNPFYQDKIYFEDAFKTEEEAAIYIRKQGKDYLVLACSLED